MQPPAPPRFYYLANFHKALAWLAERHADLLDAAEHAFITGFVRLPPLSQALLVRMIMRKGPHFRASKLVYEEIGCPLQAAAALLEAGWVTRSAALSLDALCGLLRLEEIRRHFRDALPQPTLNKTRLRAHLAEHFDETRPFADWCPALDDTLLSLTIGERCERLRLMFFGNLRQDWSEFVLADLGILRYENVPLDASSRGLRTRGDIDAYLHLHRCREAFESGEPIDDVLHRIGPCDSDNPYLLERRGKLLLLIGQRLEREGDLDGALAAYADSGYSGARLRRIRVLERGGRFDEAYALACQAADAPEDDGEAQRVARALDRLRRVLALPRQPRARAAAAGRLELCLDRPPRLGVEQAVQHHLNAEDAPVHYVENTLICGLFGLLCWPAIFAPLPGAFFHPFHSAPADLLSPDFHRRRAKLFAACLAELDSDAYKSTIRRTHACKFGIQSPFVHWAVLDEALLEQALDCLPAAHLKAWFLRLLGDIRGNRTGMPDLIQFWPAEKRYRMIEVKGPGDRLQDNQRRWLAFCAEHGMPLDVCYVQWASA